MNNTAKPQILAILHLPPPIHGASMVGQYIKDSQLINELFDFTFVNATTSKSIEDIGKGFFKKLSSFLNLYITIFKTLKKQKFDLCYFTINAKGAAFYKEMIVVFIVKMFGVKIVYHYHNKGVAENSNTFFKNNIYRYQFKNSFTILLSPLLYKDISKYVPSNKVKYCANGIKIDETFQYDDLLKIRNENEVPIILFLSNLIESKGVYELINACEKINEKKIAFKVLFVGAESDICTDDFNTFVIKKNLQDKVFYLGKLFGKDKESFFKKANLFVFPTYYKNECFPLVLLEAMSYGLACISTNEGAISEIIDDSETGYIVTQKNEKELVERLEELLLNKNLCVNMGRAGMNKFEEKFTLLEFEKKFVNVISSILIDDDKKK